MKTENYLIIGGTGKTGKRIVDRISRSWFYYLVRENAKRNCANS